MTHEDGPVRRNVREAVVDGAYTIIVQRAGRVSVVDLVVWEIDSVGVVDVGKAGRFARLVRRRGGGGTHFGREVSKLGLFSSGPYGEIVL